MGVSVADEVRRRRWGAARGPEDAAAAEGASDVVDGDTRGAPGAKRCGGEEAFCYDGNSFDGVAKRTPAPDQSSLWAASSWFAGQTAHVAATPAPAEFDDPQFAKPGDAPKHRPGFAAAQNRFLGSRSQQQPHKPTSSVVNLAESRATEDEKRAAKPLAPTTGGVIGAKANDEPGRGSVTAASRAKAAVPGRKAGADAGAFVFSFERMRWELDGVPARPAAATQVPAPPTPPRQHPTAAPELPVHEPAEPRVLTTEEREALDATRVARHKRFGEGHEAALEVARKAPRPTPGSKPRRRLLPSAPVPYAAAGERERDLEEGEPELVDAWTAFRVPDTGEQVYVHAVDIDVATVQAWRDGDVPWPQVCTLSVSRAAREGLPRYTPGPSAGDELLERAHAAMIAWADEETREEEGPTLEAAPGTAPEEAERQQQIINQLQRVSQQEGPSDEASLRTALDKSQALAKRNAEAFLRERRRVRLLEEALRAAGVDLPELDDEEAP